MQPKRPKTELERLTEIWYKKLAKIKSPEYPEGFKDIEQDEDRLKSYASGSNKFHGTLTNWEAKAAYYQMASNFLEEYKFETRREQIIWEYHSNGIGIRDIAKILKKARIPRTKKDIVAQIIQKLKHKMYAMYVEKKTEYHE